MSGSHADPFSRYGTARLHLGGACHANAQGFWRSIGKPADGGYAQLSNFLARIVLDRVIDDDSSEPRREYTVEARVFGDPPIQFDISAADYDGLTWAATHLGARAVIFPGHQCREHIAAAIRLASGKVPQAICYAHLGWRQIDGKWVFLHAGGAIRAYPPGLGPRGKPDPGRDLRPAGPMGPIDAGGEVPVEVRPDPGLRNFTLPPPPVGAELREAVTSSLLFLKLAPDHVTFPLYGSMWRAVLGNVRFAVHVDGPTGSRKTELAAILQRHFGAAMRADSLPANWSSTANSLEHLAHLAKDCLLTVDDYCPTTQAEAARLTREADRLLRNAANGAGRGRARPDGTTRHARPPRALILSTGEVGLQGRSLNARTVGIEVMPTDVDLKLLTLLQEDADRGRLAQAMSGLIAWLAPQLDQVRAELADYVAEARYGSDPSAHGRTIDQVAEITFSLALFLEFAEQVGAISEAAFHDYWERNERAFETIGAVQSHRELAVDHATVFLNALREAVAMGRAHLAGCDGTVPGENAERWGWVGSIRLAEEPDGDVTTTWSPRGNRIGWTDESFVYLLPEASLAEAERLCRDTGRTLSISSDRVLGRLLDAKGLLEKRDKARHKYTTRRWLQGARRNIYMLLAETLMETAPETAFRMPAGTTVDDILEA